MPQVTITIYTCTLCGREHRENVQSFTLTGTDGTMLNYDVCAACAGKTPWAKVFAAGEPMRTPKRPAAVNGTPRVARTGEYNCPDCEFVASNPQGLGAHRSHRHGYVSPKKQVTAV